MLRESCSNALFLLISLLLPTFVIYSDIAIHLFNNPFLFLSIPSHFPCHFSCFRAYHLHFNYLVFEMSSSPQKSSESHSSKSDDIGKSVPVPPWTMTAIGAKRSTQSWIKSQLQIFLFSQSMSHDAAHWLSRLETIDMIIRVAWWWCTLLISWTQYVPHTLLLCTPLTA